MKSFANQKHHLVCAVVGLAIVAVVSCSSAVPTETPGVERLGKYLLREKAPEVEFILGYKFAASTLGDEWLLLEVALSSPVGQSATMKRENIFVRTPDGTSIPCATQKEFNEAYGSMRSKITQANVVRDPMDYWPAQREPCPVQLFVSPTEGVAFDEVSVNEYRACQGKLFFYVPGGIQPGRWVFGVDFEESDIRIPFVLEVK